MNRITLAVFTAIQLLFLSCSPAKSSEQQQIEDVLLVVMTNPQSYKCISFIKENKSETLRDQLFNRLELFEQRRKSDSSWIAWKEDDLKRYRTWATHSMIEEARKDVVEYKTKLAHTQSIVDYLNGLLMNDELDLDTVVAEYYVLTFDGTNAFGATVRNIIEAQFNENHKLVAVRVYPDDEWEIIDKIWSIPGYYEITGLE